MSTVTFAKGGGKGKGGGGIVGAAANAIGAATGDGGCGSGMQNGKRGFQPGNRCAGKRDQNSPVNVASKAHQSARRTVKSHLKAGTLASKAGRDAVRTAAAAHRELQTARAAQKAGRSAAAKATRAAARATKAASAPTPTVNARVAASAKEASSHKVDRATQHLNDLHEGAKAGALKPTDIHKHAERIARGTTKDELFAAAKGAGIDHKATTKKALVEHIKAHAHGASKPAEPAPAPVATPAPAATPKPATAKPEPKPKPKPTPTPEPAKTPEPKVKAERTLSPASHAKVDAVEAKVRKYIDTARNPDGNHDAVHAATRDLTNKQYEELNRRLGLPPTDYKVHNNGSLLAEHVRKSVKARHATQAGGRHG